MAVIAPDADRPDRAQALFAHFDGIDAFMATFDPDRYSVEDAAELLGRFTRQERQMLAARTLTAARVARGNLHARTGHRSAAEYLAAQTGDSIGESKDLIRLGENLADQPELEESFRQGKLSRRRASLVSEAARTNPGREADLVRSAETDTLPGLKDRCHRAKAQGRSKEDEARHFRRLQENRRCRTFTDDDGAFCLHAVLAPEDGARVLGTLESQADRLFDEARASGEYENPDAYRADALVALVTGQGVLGPARRKSGPGNAAPASGPGERAGDPAASISVVVDLESLRRGNVGAGGRCEIPGVGPVPVEHAHRLLGAALVELIIAHGTDVTTVYSAGRHIPRRVRSALMLRDPRCVVPGCDVRLGLENDHWVTDFAKGGLTSLDNLARLCPRHHRERTHRGFTLLRERGRWVWVAPESPVVPKRPKPKGRTKAPPPDTAPGPAGQPAVLHRE